MNAPVDVSELRARMESARLIRGTWLDSPHDSAFRLFNGFSEGYPELVLDVYARTLVVYDRDTDAQRAASAIEVVLEFVRSDASLNWIQAVVLKRRAAKNLKEQHGRLIIGDRADRKVREHNVWYALDLTAHHDASLYLDTRNVRAWLLENSAGKSVLNTFAHSGSFGVAAMAGRASRVVQLDRKQAALNLAKDSYSLNGFPIQKKDFVSSDFFVGVRALKESKQYFDCVILDPPFFAATTHGTVDQQKHSAQLINKVRPLINDGGRLMAINNAIYLSGSEYMHALESLCEDGYLKVEQLLEVPPDVIGFATAGASLPDPTPFNHSTKIAVLSVKRK